MICMVLISLPFFLIWVLFELIKSWLERRSIQREESKWRDKLEAALAELMAERFPGKCCAIKR
jgi:hypothetical protein